MTYAAKWKVLEDLLIELRKKSVATPPNIINDLRSAKLMIKISESEGSRGDDSVRLEEYLGNVEAYLITEAQKTIGSEKVDEWLRLLDEANIQTCEIPEAHENKFITGVPRDQKWLRIEPMANLPMERLQQIAKESNLSVNPQKDGRLVVYGQQEDIKTFLKKIATEVAKK
jgi:hypothetical protein